MVAAPSSLILENFMLLISLTRGGSIRPSRFSVIWALSVLHFRVTSAHSFIFSSTSHVRLICFILITWTWLIYVSAQTAGCAHVQVASWLVARGTHMRTPFVAFGTSKSTRLEDVVRKTGRWKADLSTKEKNLSSNDKHAPWTEHGSVSRRVSVVLSSLVGLSSAHNTCTDTSRVWRYAAQVRGNCRCLLAVMEVCLGPETGWRSIECSASSFRTTASIGHDFQFFGSLLNCPDHEVNVCKIGCERHGATEQEFQHTTTCNGRVFYLVSPILFSSCMTSPLHAFIATPVQTWNIVQKTLGHPNRTNMYAWVVDFCSGALAIAAFWSAFGVCKGAVEGVGRRLSCFCSSQARADKA